MMTTTVEAASVSDVDTRALIVTRSGVKDPAFVSAVLMVMQNEVICSTIDNLDATILYLSIDQATGIVRGRMNRPYVAVEYLLGRVRYLTPAGTFSTEPVQHVARYATPTQALRAGEKGANREIGCAVAATMRPYLAQFA